MSRCRQVAPDLWLGLARCTPSLADTPSRAGAAGRRRQLDRAAADLAVAAVIEVSGFRPGACATSRSHTLGVGAAVAGPGRMRVGVDLVAIDRVSRRHADAVLSRRERRVLAPYAPVGPALAWALKEAAAKASGDPLHWFPHGLRIEPGAGGLIVLAGELELAAGWEVVGELLCAWVSGSHLPPRAPEPPLTPIWYTAPPPPAAAGSGSPGRRAPEPARSAAPRPPEPDP